MMNKHLIKHHRAAVLRRAGESQALERQRMHERQQARTYGRREAQADLDLAHRVISHPILDHIQKHVASEFGRAMIRQLTQQKDIPAAIVGKVSQQVWEMFKTGWGGDDMDEAISMFLTYDIERDEYEFRFRTEPYNVSLDIPKMDLVSWRAA